MHVHRNSRQRPSRRTWVTVAAPALAACVVALSACGDDEGSGDASDAGSAGSSGSGGRVSRGGSTGVSGSAGMTGGSSTGGTATGGSTDGGDGGDGGDISDGGEPQGGMGGTTAGSSGMSGGGAGGNAGTSGSGGTTAGAGSGGTSGGGTSGAGAGGGGTSGSGGQSGGSGGTSGGGTSGTGGAGTGGETGGTGGTDVGGGGTGGTDVGGGGTGGSGGQDDCPTDPNKTAAGDCGCGFPEVPACLVHRYAFGGTDTVVTDSVGTAHGTAVRAVQANGSVALAGGQVANGDPNDQYVDLPDNIFDGMTSTTIETWVTWTPAGATNWQRIFDFGSSTVLDTPSTGVTYFFVTARAGGSNRLRAVFTSNGGGGERFAEGLAALPTTSVQHVAVVFEGATTQMTLYLNAQPQGTQFVLQPLSNLDDVNNWIGRSQYTDQRFAGLIHEFRIYSVALSPVELQASFTAGPDVVPSN